MAKPQAASRPTIESERWLARAAKVTTGTQSNLRAMVGEKPLVLERGVGLRLYDADGNDYVDFNLGMGPGLWGHAHPRYTKAVQEQVAKLLYMPSGIAHTTLEIQVAEKLCAHVPSAELVRFLSTGSEAIQLVIRLARACTGRPLFVRFESNYHGWMDNVYGGLVNPDAAAPPHAVEAEADPMATLGRSPSAMSESYKIAWNDADRLDEILRRHGRHIALVLMEPILCNGGCLPPRPGFLERVRSLCDQHGVILCFDEVITGFRIGLGGAQKELGVTPDVTTFAKGLTGGMPLSAVVGKRFVMDLLRENRVTAAGTYNASPPSMAATLASLTMLEESAGDYHRAVDRNQERLRAALRASAARHGHPLLIQGPRGLLYTEFIDRDIAYTAADLAGADVDKSRRLRLLLIDEGVVIGRGNRWFVSGVLTERDLDDAVGRIDRAFARL
jgi:glutamate-1-semialdehyde 2,1-aminomutase